MRGKIDFAVAAGASEAVVVWVVEVDVLEDEVVVDVELELPGDGVGVGVGEGVVRLVAKYEALLAVNVHKPAETTQVAGETMPSLVQPELALVDRTIFNVWPFNEVPT